MIDYKRNIDELRKLSPTADQRLWACHQACAGIPTEQLTSESFQRLLDALGDIYDLARRCDWQMEPYSAADALEDLQSCGQRARSALAPFRKD